jgi:Uncharacterized protein conserved in bacteria
MPLSNHQATLAANAKHKYWSVLNFGDCLVYALAKDLNAPLMFKGNDFGLTDLRVAEG